MKSAVVILAAVFAVTTNALPTYMEKCSESDKKLEECIIRSTKNALPHIFKGEPELQIPNLMTLNPDDQELRIDENVILSLKNIKAESEMLVPVHASMDFKTNTFIIGFKLSTLVWRADFETIGNKELQEKGKITITFREIQLNYNRKLGSKEINGAKYLQVESETTTGSTKSIEIVEHDLDTTSHTHTDEEEKALTELFKKAKEPIEKTLKGICGYLVTHVLNAYLRTVTEKEVFLP